MKVVEAMYKTKICAVDFDHNYGCYVVVFASDKLRDKFIAYVSTSDYLRAKRHNTFEASIHFNRFFTHRECFDVLVSRMESFSSESITWPEHHNVRIVKTSGEL